jgi:hypothetical protein
MLVKIEYIYPHECFGMSGPWMGRLKIHGNELKYEYLLENYVSTENGELYAFNCFQPEYVENRLLGLFKRKNQVRKFRILIYSPTIETWFISKDYWPSLYLTRMTKEQAFYTDAFHDGARDVFPEKAVCINAKSFVKIAEEEIRKALR